MSTKIMFFISTALTAFVVATLYGVVTKMSNTPPVAEAAAPAEVSQEVVADVIPTAELQPVNTAATPLPVLNHDRAALIASQAIGRQDVYSVEIKTVDGVQGFEVVFSSNDVVFVGMDQKVVSISALPTAAIYSGAYAATTTTSSVSNNGSGGGSGNGSGNGSGENDDDDDDDDDEKEND